MFYNIFMQIFSDKLFKNPIKTIVANSKLEMQKAFDLLEKYRKNFYLLGYISYDFDYLHFDVYEKFEKYQPSKVTKPFGIAIKPLISQDEYFKNIELIKKYISEGITYEVNYTYPYEIQTNLQDFELYEALLEKQTTPFNAFLKDDTHTILSFSPELFFKIEGNNIITKPMKGTIKRGKNKFEDDKNIEFLKNDIKNRAENIMIVDLLRNDLGKFAKSGSVKVDNIFEIEKHPTLFQMTSQVSAEIEDKTSLYDIFQGIFPCGSITGAPKISTMKVINEVEPYNRGIYCGAIGFLSPAECVFSVPIRILQKTKSQNDFVGNVGGAIVWNSIAQDEWDETLTKIKFLDTDFYLIETFKDNVCKHIQRLKNSAKILNFLWNEEIEHFHYKKDEVYRITLNKDGAYTIKPHEISPRPIFNGKYMIKLEGKINSKNPFVYHKTSIRANVLKDIFDTIRTNEKGEITEGTFTNIFIEKDGKMYTPPVTSGLLNGILRQELLTKENVFEKVLYPSDLLSAEKIYCTNSLRGIVEVELC
jgi:para-aminobenzoate synthetase/4-amino-4-deoxychorismate lyase